VFGDDPTVTQLEHTVAQLVGKPNALFLPTATMANLVALMTHCWGRGYSVIMGDKSHIYLYEQGGVSHIAGALAQVIPNLPDGTFDLAVAEAMVDPGLDYHCAETKLICVENTHNVCGGLALPLAFCE
jgi:threonine aldolase